MDFFNSIGLDEVGRWPLAWPVSVGGVFCLPNFWNNLPDWYSEVTDSKKLSVWQRSYLAGKILSHPDILISIHSSSAKIIDRYGIVYAIRKASLQVIDDLVQYMLPIDPDYDPKIILDGKTDYGIRQKIPFPLETLVHGDALVWQISAASIVAKVQRDNYMTTLSQKKKYRLYRFDCHKGYGTVLHRSMIAQYGLSDIHRKSFCRNITITS